MQSMDCAVVREWQKKNLIPKNTFKDLDPESELAKKYAPVQLISDDLYFTDEIEDDRINTTAKFADYDWMNYTYDTRIPTNKIGTLSIRFEYSGITSCSMYIIQFLPDYLTHEGNYVTAYHYTFPSEMFDKYMKMDMTARIANLTSEYAYNMEEIILAWFNDVLTNGAKEPVTFLPDDIEWISIRRMKPKPV